MMRLILAGFLLCGVVTALTDEPYPCQDLDQQQRCRTRGGNCLTCPFDDGPALVCVPPSIRDIRQATRACLILESRRGAGGGGGLNPGLTGECSLNTVCNNGQPCVVCNLGSGVQSYCPDPNDPSRDFCNPDLFQGVCRCPQQFIAPPEPIPENQFTEPPAAPPEPASESPPPPANPENYQVANDRIFASTVDPEDKLVIEFIAPIVPIESWKSLNQQSPVADIGWETVGTLDPELGSQEPELGSPEPELIAVGPESVSLNLDTFSPELGTFHSEPEFIALGPESDYQEPEWGHLEPESGYLEPESGYLEPESGYLEPEPEPLEHLAFAPDYETFVVRRGFSRNYIKRGEQSK